MYLYASSSCHLPFTQPNSILVCVQVAMSVRAGIAAELHRQSRINFPRRSVHLKGITDLYQADLVDMSSFSRANNGFKYILTIINCFTKYALAIPLRTKTAIEIESVLKPVLNKHSMKNFHTDQGTEFFNSRVKKLLKEHNINHYHTFSEMKASIIERFNRTLKNNMWKKFSELGSFRWLDILPKLIKTYNNSVHSTIGMKPVEVNRNNERNIFKRILSKQKMVSQKRKFNVGDKVRISRIQKQFSKGYWPRWSNEIYTVHKVQFTKPITYILKDEKNCVLEGGFYEQELSKTKFKNIYLIEKVLKKKGDKLLVRWLGFDKTHDSWISKKDLK